MIASSSCQRCCSPRQVAAIGSLHLTDQQPARSCCLSLSPNQLSPNQSLCLRRSCLALPVSAAVPPLAKSLVLATLSQRTHADRHAALLATATRASQLQSLASSCDSALLPLSARAPSHDAAASLVLDRKATIQAPAESERTVHAKRGSTKERTASRSQARVLGALSEARPHCPHALSSRPFAGHVSICLRFANVSDEQARGSTMEAGLNTAALSAAAARGKSGLGELEIQNEMALSF